MFKKKVKINRSRLLENITRFASIGKTDKNGVCRLALSELDKQARDLFVAQLKNLGAVIEIDEVGNIFARYNFKNMKHDTPILIGSHLDSQPTGGRYDGVYGVLASIEVLQTLVENDISLEYPLEIVSWTNEEGCRFSPSMMGSGVYAGVYDEKDIYNIQDKDGLEFKQELEKIHYFGKKLENKYNKKCYFELHIEQGPVLEKEEKDIGIVMGALGQKWFDLEITGFELHAGPVPMDSRKDALFGASLVIKHIRDIGIKFEVEGEMARSTVGMLEVFPNSRNVIPGNVKMSIDIRNSNQSLLDSMEKEVIAGIKEIIEHNNLEYSLNKIADFSPTFFDGNCIDSVKKSLDYLEYSNMEIFSGAGHDAVFVSKVIPTSMIFIPCEKGISHNELENASDNQIENGANVLLHSVINID